MRLKEQGVGAKKKTIMLSVPENRWKQTEMKTCHNCPVNLKMKEGVHLKLNFCWVSVFTEREPPAYWLEGNSLIVKSNYVPE